MLVSDWAYFSTVVAGVLVIFLDVSGLSAAAPSAAVSLFCGDADTCIVGSTSGPSCEVQQLETAGLATLFPRRMIRPWLVGQYGSVMFLPLDAFLVDVLISVVPYRRVVNS